MSNSSLVNYTLISPNRNSPRKSKIDTITIHCVVGQVTVERLGAIFAKSSKQASSNYGVGKDGRIGMYVSESDRSWCTSNAANDNRAVTIEVASDTAEPYAVTDAAYNALIKLVADICKRNGISKLVWSANKNDRVKHLNGCNMTVHRDYANKSCPGSYLYNRHGDIASKVNAILNASTPSTEGVVEVNARVLKKGMKGNDVRMAMLTLKDRGFYTGTISATDKLFGAGMQSAVIKYQAAKGLAQDGVIGQNTWNALLSE